MKLLKSVLLAAVAAVALVVPAKASAQIRFGVKVGTEVNKMKFSKDVLKTENRAGFTGGLMLEGTVPVVGIGFDLSAMYVHRVNSAVTDAALNMDSYRKRDYIEIPLNLKWKIGIPVISRIICPYIFTGPDFAFLCSKKAISNAYKNKSVDISWNFGLGVQLINHLQIGASYGLGLTGAIETLTSYEGQKIDGKNNYWTITAAWLF